MLADALLEPATDFTIRRRLPRILATCPTPRTLDGVVRGLAIEYLDQVLPAAVLERLRAMMAATPSASDAPSRSGSPPPARQSSTPR